MDITEFERLTPTRVDAVATPANGIGFLMLKSLDDGDAAAVFADGLCGVSGCEVCKERYLAIPDDALAKAKMKAKERHALDDSDFAFPDMRKEPLNDESHVRNAISRFSQVQGASAADKKKAARRIMSAAHKYDIEVSDDSDVAQAAKQTAPDKSVPRSEAESQTREVEPDAGEGCAPEPGDGGTPTHQDLASVKPSLTTGECDTAPDKSVPRAEAESQTNAVKADLHDGKGDAAPDDDDEARREAESQTEKAKTLAMSNTDPYAIGKAVAAHLKASADSDPGSSDWEHKDVALGEKAEHLVSQLAEVVRTFTEREKAEGGASKQTRRVLAGIKYLNQNPNLLKECADMATDELTKALDELGAARLAKKAERKTAKEEKAKKAEKKAAKAAKKAAKATEGSANADLTKALDELNTMRETVEKMASEDGKRVVLNGAGIAAVLRGPEGGNVFKQFEDEFAKAKEAHEKEPNWRTAAEMQQAGFRMAAAKLIRDESRREANPALAGSRFGRDLTPLFQNRHALPDDSKVSYR